MDTQQDFDEKTLTDVALRVALKKTAPRDTDGIGWWCGGWRATSEILLSQGHPELAARVRQFVAQMT
jgi:hypothetical protein